ncbi:Nuclear receptor coactivator 4 [Aphelenchoides avenae]|nr:Nuclear receptor coactivator 4 [Aphelenchus avenae]
MNQLPSAPQPTAEHILRQKSTSLENAAARLTAIKSHLRVNSEQVRKDISTAVSHQLACLRAREQELLSQLENVVRTKEQLLTEQQEQINQAIGACKQGLECIALNKTNPSNVQEMLFRLNSMDLRPRDNSRVTFEFDPSDVRRAVSSFGQVVTTNFVQMSESLPLDVEEYEEESTMAHKSVMRLPSGNDDLPRNRMLAKGMLYNWPGFTKAPSPADDDFEVIRNRSSSVASSSVDTLSLCENVEAVNYFPKNLENIMRSPVERWLRPTAPAVCSGLPGQIPKSVPTSNQLPANFYSRSIVPELSDLMEQMRVASSTQHLSQPANERKRLSDDWQPTAIAAKKQQVDFGTVITSILESDSSQWLSKAKTSKSTSSERKSENPVRNRTPFAGDDMTQWLREYPAKKRDRPVNEMPEDRATWESVTGWKKILEEIHGSGENEWLAPSSRKAANESHT